MGNRSEVEGQPCRGKGPVDQRRRSLLLVVVVDGRGKVAGDLDAAGTTLPGGPAGSGGFGVFARPRRLFLYQAF